MSALAVPAPRPTRPQPGPYPAAPGRRGHLELVGPHYVPAAVAAPEARPPAARPAPLRLTARGRVVRNVLLLLVAVGVAVAAGGWLGSVTGGTTSYDGPVETVSVSAGDTLWGIASGVSAVVADPRVVVSQIQELNSLSSGDLAVGQQLLVPAG